MNTKLKFYRKVILIGALLLSFYSCSKDNGSETGNLEVGILIKESQIHGKILTDSKGKTLYFFSNDSKGQSSCTGSCMNNWPVYYDREAKGSKLLDRTEIGEITRADGSKQITYKGWPLYYFIGDGDAGEVGGDGMNDIWFVAKPDYLLMVCNAQLVGHDGENYKSDYSLGDGKTIYFTDGNGRTLYAFRSDGFNDNTFTKSDFSNDGIWPIYQTISGSLPSIVSASDISSIDVFGKKQLTYRGWPLYYFGNDLNRGDNKGISFPAPGVWPIVNLNTQGASSAE